MENFNPGEESSLRSPSAYSCTVIFLGNYCANINQCCNTYDTWYLYLCKETWHWEENATVYSNGLARAQKVQQ